MNYRVHFRFYRRIYDMEENVLYTPLEHLYGQNSYSNLGSDTLYILRELLRARKVILKLNAFIKNFKGMITPVKQSLTHRLSSIIFNENISFIILRLTLLTSFRFRRRHWFTYCKHCHSFFCF